MTYYIMIPEREDMKPVDAEVELPKYLYDAAEEMHISLDDELIKKVKMVVNNDWDFIFGAKEEKGGKKLSKAALDRIKEFYKEELEGYVEEKGTVYMDCR